MNSVPGSEKPASNLMEKPTVTMKRLQIEVPQTVSTGSLVLYRRARSTSAETRLTRARERERELGISSSIDVSSNFFWRNQRKQIEKSLQRKASSRLQVVECNFEFRTSCTP